MKAKDKKTRNIRKKVIEKTRGYHFGGVMIIENTYFRIFPKIKEALKKVEIIGNIKVISNFSEWECDEKEKNGFVFSFASPENFLVETNNIFTEKIGAFLLLDLNQENFRKVLKKLHCICKEQKIPILIYMRNAANKENRMYEFFSCKEKTKDSPWMNFFQMEKELRELCYLQIKAFDYSSDISGEFFNENTTVPSTSLLGKYMNWLSSIMTPESNVVGMIRLIQAAEVPVSFPDKNIEKDDIFLSVITRTQGKRITELRELLLCLSAQTDDDFEVLIVGHKVSKKNQLDVKLLIKEFPSSFANRIRFLTVDVGNRSTPLNFGFEHAKGSYASIVDDDDIVMDDWVEKFHQAAEEDSGAILHAYTMEQDWERDKNGEVLRSMSAPKPIYCVPFNYVRQIHMNLCPTLGLAYPLWIFRQTNIRFNETLDTTEDWEYLMRVVFLTGVKEVPSPTSVYRIWINANNSRTEHDSNQWAINRLIACNEINKMPILLPPRSASGLEEIFLAAHREIKETALESFGNIPFLYIDIGNGYDEKLIFSSENTVKYPVFNYEFTGLKDYEIVGNLRFDPSIQGGIAVHTSLCVTLITDNGKKRVHIPFSDCVHNGYIKQNYVVFLKEDPQILIPIPLAFHIEEVIVTGEILTKIPPEIADEMFLEINNWESWEAQEAERLVAEGVVCQENGMASEALLARWGLEAILYINLGEGYNEKLTFSSENAVKSPAFSYEFTNLKDYKIVEYLRFDPSVRGGIAVHTSIGITLISDNGRKRVRVPFADCLHNGYVRQDYVVFLKEDPQILIPVPFDFSVEKVIVTGELLTIIPNQIIDEILLDASNWENWEIQEAACQLANIPSPSRKVRFVAFSKKVLKKILRILHIL